MKRFCLVTRDHYSQKLDKDTGRRKLMERSTLRKFILVTFKLFTTRKIGAGVGEKENKNFSRMFLSLALQEAS